MICDYWAKSSCTINLHDIDFEIHTKMTHQVKKFGLFLFGNPPWPETDDDHDESAKETVHIGLTSWVIESSPGRVHEGSHVVTLKWPTKPFRNYLKLARSSSQIEFRDTNATLLYESNGT
jgi:hypothetical protein